METTAIRDNGKTLSVLGRCAAQLPSRPFRRNAERSPLKAGGDSALFHRLPAKFPQTWGACVTAGKLANPLYASIKPQQAKWVEASKRAGCSPLRA